LLTYAVQLARKDEAGQVGIQEMARGEDYGEQAIAGPVHVERSGVSACQCARLETGIVETRKKTTEVGPTASGMSTTIEIRRKVADVDYKS
jgi:hypothetical protein